MEPSNRKTISAIFLLFSAVFLTTGCKENSPQSSATEGAVLVIEPSHVNLGSINEGESKTGEVAVLNKSRFPVTIEKISASCGCTSAKVADENIPPGGRTTLSVELSPQGRRGPFGSTVSIAWKEQKPSEPASGEVTASFQANGLYVANLTPGHIDFGTVPISGEPPTQVISVTRGTQDIGFVDVAVSSESPAIGTSIVKKSADQWQIEIKLLPTGLPSGPLRSPLRVAFQDANGKDLHRSEISARGEIKGLVSARPKSLFFGVLPQGVEKTGRISLDVSEGRIAKVKSIRVEPESGCLTLKLGSAENTVEYTLRTQDKSGNLSGRAYVDFEDSNLGNIAVPFIVYIKEDKKQE